MWLLVGGVLGGETGGDEEEWSERDGVVSILQPGPQTAPVACREGIMADMGPDLMRAFGKSWGLSEVIACFWTQSWDMYILLWHKEMKWKFSSK